MNQAVDVPSAQGLRFATLRGDYNNDGAVNAADYVVWRKGIPPNTQAAYNTWRLHFGGTNSGGGDHNPAVPEPLALMNTKAYRQSA